MRTTFFAVMLPLLLAGCASQISLREVTANTTPVTVGAKVPKTHHHAILTGYTHRVPVAPDAWVPETAAATPDADKPKEDCKKAEGATNDCPTQ